MFANHYHFVGYSHDGSSPLNTFLGHLHTVTATEINRLDHAPERQVWHNFRETLLTFEKSYLARLNDVHQNAVHHGLVPVANQYTWCSAAWFERTATRAQVSTIYGFKIDRGAGWHCLNGTRMGACHCLAALGRAVLSVAGRWNANRRSKTLLPVGYVVSTGTGARAIAKYHLTGVRSIRRV